MSEIASSDGTSAVDETPILLNRLQNDVKFPPFPDPTDEEFEEDIGDDERTFYRNKFADLDIVKSMRLHCSSCDRHLGSSTRNESRMRAHPMLRTLVCHTCHTFYNSGEFEKGDDGSELYCRWCGQGGQVYCCSDCPHVFCAKCIKRNLGVQKIKEIENTDDWKCFKCNPRCLWDLRALCWALLRYCDMKNKITYKTEDPSLKEIYQKDCATDHSDCCKHKTSRRKEKSEASKKKEDKKMSSASVISKISSAIQVRKFASINLDENSKEKKAPKRPANMNDKVVFIKNPITISSQTVINPIGTPPVKKPRMPVMNPVRFAQQERKSMTTYSRIRPKVPTMPIPIVSQPFNGFNVNNNSFHNYGNIVTNDTLNLSLDSLTQGLDMVAVASMNTCGAQNDDVVCTPDFPLEAMCEVTEDNTDDDVQCITPGPVVPPKVQSQPLPSRIDSTVLPDLSPDNIVQMTDNDVTVNSVTGGLKFRVDPQTLSSNKMYRLPDGRIFAIKANPNMPGGYSATIVAVTETGLAKPAPKGATYAAKLSAVSSSQTSTPTKSLIRSNISGHGSGSKRSSTTTKSAKVTRGTDTSSREYDLQVPIEWYRYNLVDAVDALEYSLHRLNKLKKEATCRYLRTRSVEEMKTLHRTLDRLLNTSATRFHEIKDNLNRDLKLYLGRKTGGHISDDDDDVEILPDLDDNDDPIFIDENSVESNCNDLTCNESQEVDLTGVGSSDQNESAEMLCDNASKVDKDPHNAVGGCSSNAENRNLDFNETVDNTNKLEEDGDNEDCKKNYPDVTDVPENISQQNVEPEIQPEINLKEVENCKQMKENEIIESEKGETETKVSEGNKLNGDTKQDKQHDDRNNEETNDDKKNVLAEDNSNKNINVKLEDSEMSEEMIENLLNDENADASDNTPNNKSMEIVESL